MGNWQNFVNGFQSIGTTIGGVADSIGQLTEATKGFGSQAGDTITDVFGALSETPIIKTDNQVNIGIGTWIGVGAVLLVLVYMFKRK